jgi:hypothetical protein
MGFDPRTPSESPSYKEVLLEALDQIGCGGLVLDGHHNQCVANSVAIEIIARRAERSTVKGDTLGKAIRQLLDAISPPTTEEDGDTSSQDSQHPLAIVRVRTGEDIVLVLVDLGTGLRPGTSALRRIFGLTSAEFNLVPRLGLGSSPDELASFRSKE